MTPMKFEANLSINKVILIILMHDIQIALYMYFQ